MTIKETIRPAGISYKPLRKAAKEKFCPERHPLLVFLCTFILTPILMVASVSGLTAAVILPCAWIMGWI